MVSSREARPAIFVFDTWVTNTGGGVEYDRLVAMDDDNTSSGDSGGPWFWVNTAWGIHQGDVWIGGITPAGAGTQSRQ